ncbi:hypothetical protein GCK72_008734 [Caenorhabditis remanei]|uniref:Uncharacterized protein n=1 Tax=Caenorhabditis remanei TaxID=31234 RepID=A0A6A5H0T1_CAERE|nr:hypothetical protein GCK72_008734 [Caenorhabditis remanei]KAF1760485.1 hypothetical protein GCK72_008734 [Caenorhabditis remanei]
MNRISNNKQLRLFFKNRKLSLQQNKSTKIDFNVAPASKLIPTNKDLAKTEISVVTANVTDYKVREQHNFVESQLVLPPKQAVLLKL